MSASLLPAQRTVLFLFVFLFSASGAIAEDNAPSPTEAHVKTITAKALRKLKCTPHDLPWLIAHYILGEGAGSQLTGAPADQNNAIAFLCLSAKRDDGSPVFAPQQAGALYPRTESSPSQRYQDHRNQFLAEIMLAVSTSQEPGTRPRSIPQETWQRMLAGAWQDYHLPDEPSWTLTCYLAAASQLPATREQVTSRIIEMTELLTDSTKCPPLACGGAHAYFALATLRKSGFANQIPEPLLQRVDRRLKLAAADLHRWTATFRAAASADSRRLSQMQTALSVLGHGLEWMSEYAPDSELRAKDVKVLANTTCDVLEQVSEYEFTDPGGALHAVHGLRLYINKLNGHAASSLSTRPLAPD